MIARLTGTIADKGVDHAIVDVGGVGYLVWASVGTLAGLTGKVTLRIHTHVREDTLELYGFADGIEELVFRELIATPSIGCRKAIHILSGLPAEDIVDAVRDGDARRLAKAPGVGKKTAERLVLELKDRLPQTLPSGGRGAPKGGRVLDELVGGLVNLGYRPEDARSVAQEVMKARPGAELPVLLREVLTRLRGG